MKEIAGSLHEHVVTTTCMALPRHVVAQAIQYLWGRRKIRTNQQNDCSAKVLLSLGSVGNSWPMLSDDVINPIRLESTRGEQTIPIVISEDIEAIHHPLPVHCNPEIRDVLWR